MRSIEQEEGLIPPGHKATKQTKGWTTLQLILFCTACAIIFGLLAGFLSNMDRLGATSSKKTVINCANGVYEGNQTSVSDFHFSYGKGEQKWNKYYPQCGCSGQSPIDLDLQTALLHTPQDICDEELEWRFNDTYSQVTKSTFTIYNSGHSIKMQPLAANGQLATLNNRWQPVSSNLHSQFVLDGIHFHWGSEHTVDGKRFPVEAHFVHYSSDYSDLHRALADWPRLYASRQDRYVLAVVSVLFDYDEDPAATENPVFTTFIQSGVLNNTNKLKVEQSGIDINELIPVDNEYYYYRGSLTTPSCDPVVRWNIFVNPKPVRKAQLDTFISLAAQVMDTNYRSVQENSAPVFGCGN